MDLSAKGQRVLAGFDFPNGYPRGFANLAGFSGIDDGAVWRAVWDGLDGLIRDGVDNSNNRFEIAAALNERISGGPFPFWGCPGIGKAPPCRRAKPMPMTKKHRSGAIAKPGCRVASHVGSFTPPAPSAHRV